MSFSIAFADTATGRRSEGSAPRVLSIDGDAAEYKLAIIREPGRLIGVNVRRNGKPLIRIDVIPGETRGELCKRAAGIVMTMPTEPPIKMPPRLESVCRERGVEWKPNTTMRMIREWLESLIKDGDDRDYDDLVAALEEIK